MAIIQHVNERVFTCLSTETKPTSESHGVRQGDKLVEVNTATDSTKTYIFDRDSGGWISSTMGTDNGTPIDISSLGGYGGKYIVPSTETTPDTGYAFVAIQALSDSEITLVGNIDGITNVSILSGTILYGIYTSCTLASGNVIAYQGVI